MFYLETKDGERFFTNKDSDDVAEFKSILETKLGSDAADLFSEILSEREEDALHVLSEANHKLKAAIRELDKTLEESPDDKQKLVDVLSDLQAIYLEYFM